VGLSKNTTLVACSDTGVNPAQSMAFWPEAMTRGSIASREFPLGDGAIFAVWSSG
jgi:hypothetical protein